MNKNILIALGAVAFIATVAVLQIFVIPKTPTTTESPLAEIQEAQPTIIEEPEGGKTTNEQGIEEDNSKELIKRALVEKHNLVPEEVVVTVNTNDGTYASGSLIDVNSEVGGGYWFAAKVTGMWNIVADGNGAIMCSSLVPYPDYPTGLIPECFDDETGQIVIR